MSINQNFSTDQPTLSIDFARSGKLDSRMTFSRSTVRTYFSEDGLLVSAATNVPRFNYAFPPSRNLLERTDYLSTWSKITTGSGSVSVTDNNAGAPDGTSTASLVTAVAGGTGAESIYWDIFTKGNGTYTSSIFVKAGTQTSVVLAGFFQYDQIQGFSFSFNPITGQIITTGGGTNHTVVPYPNGWYRIYFTYTGSNYANDVLRFQVYFQTSGTVSLWGPQLEEGSTITEYIANSTEPSTKKPKCEGLILEPPATNLSRFSQNFQDTWANGAGGSGTKYLNDSTVTANAGTAPDGTNTASRFQTSIGGGRITTILNSAPGTTKNQHICYSVFVKPNGTSKLFLNIVCNVSNNFSYRASVQFNLVGKGSYEPIVTAASGDGQAPPFGFATIEPLFNGWYRCSISTAVYNGSGTVSATLGEIRFDQAVGDVLVWGDQFEGNSFPTSYLATNGSTVFGASDFARITGTNFTNNYNAFEGTFFAEFTPKGTLGPDVYGGVFGVSSQTEPAPFNFILVNPYTTYGIYTATRSQTITASSVGTVNSAPNKLCKLAGSYSPDSYESCFDGLMFSPITNLGALVYDFDSFIFGSNYHTNPSSFGNLVLSKVMYYPKKLNSLHLRSLTR